jgi:hypothetical protein
MGSGLLIPRGHAQAWGVAGYSTTPLLQKLVIKSHHVVLLDNAPLEHRVAELSDFNDVSPLRSNCDVTLTFHYLMSTLEMELADLFGQTNTDGMVWVCWPKKAAQKALREQGHQVDIDENRVRDFGLKLGWVDVKVCAISEVWSGLKFVRRRADR